MKKLLYVAASIAALAIAGSVLLRGRGSTIGYQEHRIPTDQLRVVDPHPGCDVAHYHAVADKRVTAEDGTVLPDETDCGYGPVQ